MSSGDRWARPERKPTEITAREAQRLEDAVKDEGEKRLNVRVSDALYQEIKDYCHAKRSNISAETVFIWRRRLSRWRTENRKFGDE